MPSETGRAPLTVALDAAPLLGARTGMGVTVAGIVTSLAARTDLRIRAFGLTGTGWSALRGMLPAGVTPARGPMPAGPLLAVWARTAHPTIEWWTGRVDVVHGTNFVVPPAARAARVVTVADLTAVRFPEMCTPASLRYPALIRRAVARGAWVHTLAETIRDEIVGTFGADPARVRVIPPGVDAQPAAPAARPAPAGRPYVLGLGTVEPRKDFPGLVAAFDRIAGRHPDLELRIAGPDGWGSEALAAAIGGARHRDRIVRVGWVENPHSLLAGAAVFAFPSVYEGFGLPPLEAMAAGVPVVATAGGAVPEVAGDAARLVPVGDVDALAGALDEVLTDGALRDRLIAAGRERVRRFSWSGSAAALAELYREVAASA